MEIYLENGYPNFDKIKSLKTPFILMWGGRGVGKTYGALEHAVTNNREFIYMRRTQTQADMINTPKFSPFNQLNIDKGWNIASKAITKYNAGFYRSEETDAGLKPTGAPIGFTCALSTISNMRGFSAEGVTELLYDEFIPEKHERPIKKEGWAYFNAYETINRNRELVGKKPLQAICMANANDVANPLFMELGVVRKAMEMKRKGQEISIDTVRGITLINLEHSPISQQKKETALYRLTKNTTFESMSISNEFSGEEVGRISSRPLSEYKPVVAIGEICVYEHKSNRSYYVSTHKTGSPPTFGTGEIERGRFRRVYSWLWDEYMTNNIEFEEYLCEILLTKSFN